jgi:DNA-binding NtrC family response regulator
MDEPLFPARPLLMVDDEGEFLRTARLILRAEGITNLITCSDGREVLSLVKQQDIAAIALDIHMPGCNGIDLLSAINAAAPQIPVIMITASTEVETVVRCMKHGAFDFMAKPIDETRMITSLRHALQYRAMQDETARLRESLLDGRIEHPEAFAAIVTRDPEMLRIFRYTEAIARTPLPVLISGPTGVGKELMALAIHRLSGRRGEFVAINAAGTDASIFSDTLFGHVRGAFTGADRDRKGLIEQAAGGTLFLDEIGDVPAEPQIKLLRLLQENRYYPVGSDIPRTCDARITTATNRDLKALQQNGAFRADLYYRLQSHEISLPSLAARRGDIPLLLDQFVNEAAIALKVIRPRISPALPDQLQTYSFPGNVRELRSMVYDAVGQCHGSSLTIDYFKNRLPRMPATDRPNAAPHPSGVSAAVSLFQSLPDLPTLKSAEQMLIDEALNRSKGNITLAAHLLGMSRQALSNRINRA